jgi:hypothetical protein
VVASLSVFEPRDFDFGGGYLASLVVVIPLNQKIDVTAFGCGEIIFRLHSGNVPTNASVQIILIDAAPTNEDPRSKFQGKIVGTAGFQAVNTQTKENSVALATGFVNFGCPYVAAYLVVLQPPSQDPTFKVTLSAELALRDRRDPWTPALLGSKLRLWTDQRDQTVVGGAISPWGDQSGNAYNFAAGTAPSTGGAINGWPAPKFNSASSQYLTGTSLSNIVTASAYHVFVVANPTVLAAPAGQVYLNPAIIGENAGEWGLVVSSNGIQGWHWTGTLAVATAPISILAGIWRLIEWSYDGTTMSCQVNARAPLTTTGAPIGSITPTVQLGTAWVGTPFFTGTIASVIVCNQKLNTNEAAAVRGYLSSKYGIPA